MDLAKTLIRSVVRTFYELHHVLVIDALMVHSALGLDDMYHLTSMQQKDLRKFLGRLKEDRLVAVQQRQEVRQGSNRPIHRDYYYINFHHAIDAIKYRVWQLTEKIKEMYKPSSEKKDYFCPRCKSQWTQLEVLDKFSPEGFLCHRCDFPLERDEISVADRAGSERQAKLMSQIDPLLQIMSKLDDELKQGKIPPTDFASVMAVAIPVQRNEMTHPTQIYEVVQDNTKGQAKNLKPEVMVDLDVTISTEAGREEDDRKARERKMQQEQQNALPSWHTESTIGLGAAAKPDPSSRINGTTAPNPATTVAVKKEDGDSKTGIVETAQTRQMQEMEEYFASLKQEEERRAALPPQSDDEDDEDNEDDGFEEVEIASTAGASAAANGAGKSTSGINTPISSASTSAGPSAPPSGALNGNGNGNGSGTKRKMHDEHHLSGAANGNGNGNGDGNRNSNGSGNGLARASSTDESPSKKIKLEAGATKIEAHAHAVQEPSGGEGKDVDSDEDEEFEDAL